MNEERLKGIMAQMIFYEKQAKEAAEQLRSQCDGPIDPDCAGWLTSLASAEVWHAAVVMLAPLVKEEP